MAVVNVPSSSTLVIKVQAGISETGKPVYKNRSYSNVKTAAADADVYAVGTAIADVQKYSLAEIDRRNLGSLMEQ